MICNAFFAALNLFASPGEIWFIFPMLGWGVGLASHAVSVFGLPRRGAGWEERRVRELMGEEGSTERLKSLLDEELGRRKRAGSGPEQGEAARLRERIEHLEAIVTSRDWDALETAPAGPPVPLPETEGSDAATEAARIATRVR